VDLRLETDATAHQLNDLVPVGFGPQGGHNVYLSSIEKTTTQFSAGREAKAVAPFTERLAHCADKSDAPLGAGQVKNAGRPDADL